jgi:H+-translocating NAD(P) transhydrogenase subunit alpha
MDRPAPGVVVAVLRERSAGERRVALVPAAIAALTALGAQVVIEPGAGEEAGFSDDAYREAGAQVAAGALAGAGVVALVGPPPDDLVDELAPGTLIAGFLAPLTRPDVARRLAERGVDSLAMELVPRITRAQAMDALSSQATVAGYRAVLLAAQTLPRFFPMLMTAAGTARPAQVLVLGAGVAGLQAIATARRLGALVTGYDVRAAAQADIASTGAAVLDVPTGAADGEGGYARGLTGDEQSAQQSALDGAIPRFDVVITTAQVPGGTPPRLVSGNALAKMRPGSVLIDLAASAAGGNVEGSVPDTRTVTDGGVTIIGAAGLASTVPGAASTAYARNLLALLTHLMPGGEVVLDLDDEILGAITVSHGGRVVHPRVRAALADVKEIRS